MSDLKLRTVWTRGSETKDLNIKSFSLNRQPNSAAELILNFSNKDGKYNSFFQLGDKIEFYSGIGALSAVPLFTGFPVEVGGLTEKSVTCVDYMT
jgi:hypothetical protein